jgi:hypothetical protein
LLDCVADESREVECNSFNLGKILVIFFLFFKRLSVLKTNFSLHKKNVYALLRRKIVLIE